MKERYSPGRYEFSAIIGPALNHNDIAILGLGKWCDNYGNCLWNGETYDVSLPGEPSGTHTLRPIYKWDEENDWEETIGYSLDGWDAYYPEGPKEA